MSSSPLKNLVILAHPHMAHSHANKAVVKTFEQRGNYTIHDLYALYPDFKIDVPREQDALLAHDVLIFLFPLYWYSAPSLLKEWIDDVLLYNFSYGGEHKLEGKHCLTFVTVGGASCTYQSGAHQNFTLSEFLRPYQQTALYMRMHWHPARALYLSKAQSLGSHVYVKRTDEEIQNDINASCQVIERIGTPS